MLLEISGMETIPNALLLLHARPRDKFKRFKA